MRLSQPWLWISPALAHKIGPTALNGLTLFNYDLPPKWNSFTWRGLEFPNRIGIAGGVDKNAENIKAWWALGCGFIEVGTITPLPQPGNSAPVVKRNLGRRAIWNRMGFPSQGIDRIIKRIEAIHRPFHTPIFANIGKNAVTPLENAHEDYIRLLNQLNGHVDGFVINISSPNTKGLRELLKPERLREFLAPIMNIQNSRKSHTLLKLSPDLSDDELEQALTTSYELGVDGWVLTNTSQGLREGLEFPTEGGVSGAPLTALSREFLQKSLRILGKRREGKLVVSVGGIMSAKDVDERLNLGADLVQAYSALVFEGPWFFKKVAKCQQLKT